LFPHFSLPCAPSFPHSYLLLLSNPKTKWREKKEGKGGKGSEERKELRGEGTKRTVIDNNK
jgi:hypothetical protein